MDLRAERTQDRVAVRDIHRRAFRDHGDVVATLVDALREDDPAALSIVAEEAGEVGHVMFSRSLLDAPRRLIAVQVLSPLAIAPDRQRRGIGSALMRHGLDLLDQRGVPLVLWRATLGTTPAPASVPAESAAFVSRPLRIPDAAFQALPLTAYEPWMNGTLVYSATFWDHDCVGLRVHPTDAGG